MCDPQGGFWTGELLDKQMLHFASIKSLVVIIWPFLIKQEALFSANWLYFQCIERSAFRFCQLCILQPEQPAETCTDSGNNQNQKCCTCSPFAPEPDSHVNFRTYVLGCLSFKVQTFLLCCCLCRRQMKIHDRIQSWSKGNRTRINIVQSEDRNKTWTKENIVPLQKSRRLKVNNKRTKRHVQKCVHVQVVPLLKK